MKEIARFFRLVALAWLASASSAFAGELPKNGSYDYTA